jgi:hypothetical protein
MAVMEACTAEKLMHLMAQLDKSPSAIDDRNPQEGGPHEVQLDYALSDENRANSIPASPRPVKIDVPHLDLSNVEVPKWLQLTSRSGTTGRSASSWRSVVSATIKGKPSSQTQWRRMMKARKMNEKVLQEVLLQERREAEAMTMQQERHMAGELAINEERAKMYLGGETCPVSATFSVSCQTTFGQEVRVVGNVAILGHWDPHNGAAMQWTDGHIWVTTVDFSMPLSASDKSLEYKYVLMSNGQVEGWEPRDNRVLCKLHSGSQWRRSEMWGAN